MMNAPIPRPPRRAPLVSVRAIVRITPAVLPLVTQLLVPFKIQDLPSFTAWVVSAAASEPASGSDKAKAPRISPRAIFLRNRSFCCSLP